MPMEYKQVPPFPIEPGFYRVVINANYVELVKVELHTPKQLPPDVFYIPYKMTIEKILIG